MYGEFEGALGELDRARAIFSLAIGLLGGNLQGADQGSLEVRRQNSSSVQPPTAIALDMPEKVWKAYIDFEVENG